jgi:diguanylate cyclase (GGDEF)-like protein
MPEALTFGRQILLIEGDLATQQVTNLHLKKQYGSELKLFYAYSLSEALQVLTNNRIEAILLDLNLPDSSGLKTLERIISVARGIAIVVLTGSKSEHIGLEAVRMGAQDFLNKETISGPMLERALNFAIERNEMLRMFTQLAVTDTLCQGFNRRGFTQSANQSFSAASAQTSFCLFCFDLNKFKAVNDLHGHDQGDLLLQKFAEILKKTAGNSIITARTGGDYFVAMANDCGVTQAEEFLKNLKDAIHAHAWDSLLKEPIDYSAGYVFFTGKDLESHSLKDLLNYADTNLYIAKTLKSPTGEITANRWKGGYIYSAKLAHEKRSATTIDPVHSLKWKEGRGLMKLCKWTAPKLWVHQKFVGQLSACIAERLKMDVAMQHGLRWAGNLHDIGKLGLSSALLDSPRRLTTQEYSEVKAHTLLGEKLLRSFQSPWSNMQLLVAKHHHECWDGSGYPSGFRGKEIPQAARIVAVADSYHAIISERSYKKALSPERAVNEIRQHSGQQFDPEIADCLHSLHLDGSLHSIKENSI